MKSLLTLVFVPLCGLVACSSTNAPGTAVGQAAATPFNDLNLVNGEIPPVLKAAQRAPYEVPSDRACPALGTQVRALDDALGPDLDTPPSADNPGLIERGGDAAAGALKGAVEGAIPFRGWIRKLSGAERYSKDVAAAIAAGTVRRAYLKGLITAGNCPRPAASPTK